MNVPNIESRKADTTSVTFHLRSIPRFSCTMIEWRNAVFTRHGTSDAFSTGAHAQYPAQPADDSEGVEEPGNKRPSSHRSQPLGVEPACEQRRDRERKWNRRADVPQIEIGRMDRHSGILQLRIQSTTIGGNEVEPLEGIGAEADRAEKENKYQSKRAGDVRHQLAIARAIRPQSDRGVNREDQRPKEQRSRLSAPEGGDRVDLGQIRARV